MLCRAYIHSLWDETWNDRRQELVFIGQSMDEAVLRRRLDACLLTDAEMDLGPAGWAAFPDPFAPWDTPRAEIDDEPVATAPPPN